AEQSSAVLIGCGMGLNLHTKELVSELVRSCTKPMIIDADGINALAANIDILKNIKAPVILTPHPGEMSRLTGMSIADIERDRVNVAR
ncbi:MAG TPA: bifunctional ADP-dependent NAD(P)H-hydrate dehydratase/NAD(P)H-hydrate epimerase, partial [Ruminococcaceae bacterium]|nr:bifunctional ADP-dependent NAD(P)H-hydrate dehydratase/NAD(P)H-hydrate epimerase [Oscillospiraceae bacterium]